MSDPLRAIRGGLVVSCQAPPGHPLEDLTATVLMARCAARGGAVALRINGPDHVAAVKAATGLPVIGIDKVWPGQGRARITPTFERAVRLIHAGADVVAVESTRDSEGLDLIRRLRHRALVMADVSTLEEGLRAAEAGADLIASTLSGYTPETAENGCGPDLALVGELAGAGMRCVAEGRLHVPGDAAEAIRRGAWSVVIGTAITDPIAITGWFAGAVSGAGGRQVAGAPE